VDELFQIPLKVLVVDGFMPLTVIEGIILFCSGECGVVLYWSRIFDQRLVLDGIEDLVDWEPERGEVFCLLEGLERTR